MQMLGNKPQSWVEEYLYRAMGHRALEQSVFAAGEREGFSERKLRKAGQGLGVTINRGCWELHPVHCASLVQRDVASLTLLPQPAVPVAAGMRRAA